MVRRIAGRRVSTVLPRLSLNITSQLNVRECRDDVTVAVFTAAALCASLRNLLNFAVEWIVEDEAAGTLLDLFFPR